MDATTFAALALACAPQVHLDTARAVVQVESGFNPWALGVVGGSLVRQPRRRAEALATAEALQARGWNFSVGLGQINARNLERLGLSISSALDPCTNLAAMQTVLTECFARARARRPTTDQPALRQALSCYYSGRLDVGSQHGYVSRVVSAAVRASQGVDIPHPKEKP